MAIYYLEKNQQSMKSSIVYEQVLLVYNILKKWMPFVIKSASV